MKKKSKHWCNKHVEQISVGSEMCKAFKNRRENMSEENEEQILVQELSKVNFKS